MWHRDVAAHEKRADAPQRVPALDCCVDVVDDIGVLDQLLGDGHCLLPG